MNYYYPSPVPNTRLLVYVAQKVAPEKRALTQHISAAQGKFSGHMDLKVDHPRCKQMTNGVNCP